MMYKNKAAALRALSRLTALRTELVGEEVITPAEEQLLEIISTMGRVKRRAHNRKQKRMIIGLAKSLGLYPLPEWWKVKRRISEKQTAAAIFSVDEKVVWDIETGPTEMSWELK